MSKAVIPPPQYAHLLMGIFLYAWESLDAPAAASSPYSTTRKRPPVEWRALWFPNGGGGGNQDAAPDLQPQVSMLHRRIVRPFSFRLVRGISEGVAQLFF